MIQAGTVGIIGYPNVGKSTLLNFLIGEKISIVSEKPQTTRRRIVGIVSDSHFQIVFYDAPGIVKSETGINAYLGLEVQDVLAMSDANLVTLSLDLDSFEQVEETIAKAKSAKKPWMILVNKIDLLEYQNRLDKIRARAQEEGVPFLSVSLKDSKKGKNQELRLEILNSLAKLLPESPEPLFDPAQFTLETERSMVAEIIREKCFELLKHEVPYQLAVRILKFDETQKIPHIYAEIIVGKENHKGIVIGKEAEMLKMIGSKSRKDIEKLLGTSVYLDLKVMDQPGWFENARLMKELGYETYKTNR